ncbi:MAG: hypothetical protein ACOZE5_18815 [Verrucomicrobiota bacterium]
MKQNFLLIAALAGLVSTASAALPETDANVLVLPTCVVTAPRHSPAEQQINTRLREFRQAALPRVAILPAPGLPKFDPVQSVKDNPAARATLTTVAAKF